MKPRGFRKKRYLLLAYLLLLVLSHLVRRQRDVGDGREATLARLAAVDGTQALARTVCVAYQDLRPPAERGALPLLIVHGSPMKSFDLGGLARLLAADRRVILPDLPGFGRSQRFVPDYSMAAHGRYLSELLAQLDVRRVHVLAYSLGGGAALWLQAVDPERVASLTLVSSIGVQELELLGNYELNHALHGVQLAGFWCLSELVPHFGWLDGYILNTRYARNFYDSDQRPLRGLLERFQPPMLIVHAPDDVLVPPAAAREHFRIVPQSELAWIEGGHAAALFDPARVAPPVVDFLRRVDAGTALTRAQAGRERQAEAAVPFERARVERLMGLSLLIVLSLIALGTFISEDLACIGAGLMAAHGTITFAAATWSSFIGILVGDLLLFGAGRWLGRPALRRRPLKWFVKEGAIEESSTWFEAKGVWAIVLSRFIPGSRLPTYFAAGLLHTSLVKFLILFVVAGIVWAPLLVWLSMVVGGRLMAWLHAYKTLTVVSVVILLVVLWITVELIVPLFSYRGRRLLLSAWRRKLRWEFWPPWVFYPPLLVYLAVLAVRHRSATVFTACNPALPAGGFIGESKAQILAGLSQAGPAIAPWRLIPAGEGGAAAARAFMQERDLTFPVVLKPDVGQRGLGVAVVRSDEQLADYFARARGATLVQEFIPGLEFGLFYYRYPSAPVGQLLSITDKRFPSVVGDGVHNLEHLILADDRAVCMAHVFLRRFKNRLFQVPAAGECVPLVDLGTHCRGAVFLDGTRHVTPELEALVERLSRAYDGFYFGRYDVRVPSVEDLRAGRNIRVIELNGVTSEATAIYEPGNSLLAAYRLLMTQWRIAFEIGAENRARGVRVTPAREILRALAEYRPAAEA